MIIEAIGTGSTIEEARQNAIKELSVDPDNYEIELITEIIDQPEKKIFGLFGGKSAKVRVYYEVEDKKEEKPVRKPKPIQKQQPKQERKPENRVVEEKKTEVKEAPVAPASVEKEIPVETEPKKEIDPMPAQIAEKYLREILEGFGITDVVIKTEFNDDGAVLVLEGDSLGIIIGRRGETLDAIQYLIGLVANRANNSYYRISINTGNYREKRETSIEILAKKTAARALKTGKNISVEPMNPYERRIIHTTVQEIEGVSSWSMGEDSKRHVVIGPTGVNENQDGELFASFNRNNRRHSNQRGRYNGSRGGNRGGRNYGNRNGGYKRNNYNSNYSRRSENNNRSENNTGVITNVDRTPTRSTVSAPLYGKIDVNRQKED